jgi:hypothetical protein
MMDLFPDRDTCARFLEETKIGETFHNTTIFKYFGGIYDVFIKPGDWAVTFSAHDGRPFLPSFHSSVQFCSGRDLEFLINPPMAPLRLRRVRPYSGGPTSDRFAVEAAAAAAAAANNEDVNLSWQRPLLPPPKPYQAGSSSSSFSVVGYRGGLLLDAYLFLGTCLSLSRANNGLVTLWTERDSPGILLPQTHFPGALWAQTPGRVTCQGG